MRHEYVGDIGDFANNGLMRYLCGVTGFKIENHLRLGVVSYLNDSQPVEAAGNKIGYLNASEYNDHLYRECDPVLYDTLQNLVGQSLVQREIRNINQIERNLFLSECTQYYNRPVTDVDRVDWINDALRKTEKADVIFINSDKGIELLIETKEVDSKKRQQIVGLKQMTDSPEHTSVKELDRFFRCGKSLVIYQHNVRIDGWINTIAKMLCDSLTMDQHPRIWALHWHRESPRVYFVVSHQKHGDLFCSRIKAFLNGPWGKRKPPNAKDAKPHFTLAYSPGKITCPPSS